jgi:membrane fusion protein (multidrug efflux system)
MKWVWRSIFFVLVIGIFGGLGAGIAWYAFDFKPKFLAEVIMSAPQPPATVSAEAAREDAWAPEISGIGSLKAIDGIDVTPQVGGILKEVLFESGQDVKKGDRLAVLDTDTEEAQLRSLMVQLANAETELQRRQQVFAKGFAAKADVDTIRTQRDTFQADADRARALIAQKFIYAPWDGRLGLKNVSPGQYIAPGQTIVSLQRLDPIYVDFPVTEGEYARIKPGQAVMALFEAFPGESFPGKVEYSDTTTSQESRTIMIRASIVNKDNRLLPGMYANVSVTTGAPEMVTTVPQTAVTFSLYGDNVLVVVPAKKPDPNAKEPQLELERRVVKTGGVKEGRVQIVSGIKAGEQVVTAGQNKVDQGSRVVIDNSIALNRVDGPTLQ